MKFAHISDPPQFQLTVPSGFVQPIAAIAENSPGLLGFPIAVAEDLDDGGRVYRKLQSA